MNNQTSPDKILRSNISILRLNWNDGSNKFFEVPKIDVSKICEVLDDVYSITDYDILSEPAIEKRLSQLDEVYSYKSLKAFIAEEFFGFSR
jgi:hypothetical protein